MVGNQADCHHLASSLSENFRNTEPFDKNDARTSIVKYLTGHGLLLTMCFPFACSLGFRANHVAASWINQRIGAQHIIFSQAGVGLLLDPTVASINCLYPTDSGSDGRDVKGCGPDMLDPQFGSQGASSYDNIISRFLVRKFFNDYKRLNFGSRKAWKDIACSKFFQQPIGSVKTWRMRDNSTGRDVTFQSGDSLVQEQVGAIMGHPVCTPRPVEEEGGFLLYSGPDSWQADDFQEVVELQMELMHNSSESVLVWNEVVIGLPRQMEDIVQGIFYLEDGSPASKQRRALAHEEAELLGNKHVFKYDVGAGIDHDILRCDEKLEGAATRVLRREELPTCKEEKMQPYLLLQKHREAVSAVKEMLLKAKH
eukprot:scaffold21455_cov116-Cylindrotheca_fusiformis.AAC.15